MASAGLPQQSIEGVDRGRCCTGVGGRDSAVYRCRSPDGNSCCADNLASVGHEVITTAC